MQEATTQEVIDIVHENLDAVEVADKTTNAPIRFSVPNDSVKRGEYSLQVRVRPSREPRRWAYLYDELAEIAVAIGEKTGLNIVFTADDPAPAPQQ